MRATIEQLDRSESKRSLGQRCYLFGRRGKASLRRCQCR